MLIRKHFPSFLKIISKETLMCFFYIFNMHKMYKNNSIESILAGSVPFSAMEQSGN